MRDLIILYTPYLSLALFLQECTITKDHQIYCKSDMYDMI